MAENYQYHQTPNDINLGLTLLTSVKKNIFHQKNHKPENRYKSCNIRLVSVFGTYLK